MSVIEAEQQQQKPKRDAGGPAADLPIREVAQRTGVNPVTLRAWERRYGLLIPQRSGKGHRMYSERDVARIREILEWLARGVAIGKVRPLLDRGEQEVSAPQPEDSWEQMVRETTTAVAQLAERDLRLQLEQILASYPLPLLHDRWLVPLQRELSRQTRYGSSVAQGFFWHLLNEQLAIVLQKSRKNLRQGGGDKRPSKLLLVNFPGPEQQAFSQLFSAALIAAGFDVASLAGEVELGELAFAEEKLGAQGVICYSHNALPMAILGSGVERALRGLKVPLWFAGGVVELQHRDLQQLARARNCSLLPADCTGAVIALQERA